MKGFFYLPYRCHNCDNYFQVTIGHFDDAPMSPRCPECGTNKTRLADVEELIE
jgi:rubredoxin